MWIHTYVYHQQYTWLMYCQTFIIYNLDTILSSFISFQICASLSAALLLSAWASKDFLGDACSALFQKSRLSLPFLFQQVSHLFVWVSIHTVVIKFVCKYWIVWNLSLIHICVLIHWLLLLPSLYIFNKDYLWHKIWKQLV